MAQSKLNDLAGRFGKGPKGMGTGLKLLGLAGAAAYGISQSLFTGKFINISLSLKEITDCRNLSPLSKKFASPLHHR